MASEQPEYGLDGWFFFGSLEDDTAPQDPGTFLISVQRVDTSSDGATVPLVPAIVAYNCPSLGQYIYGGEYTVDVAPLVNVTDNPWEVEVRSNSQAERWPSDSGPARVRSTIHCH
jgi:hypothetical protein